MTRPADAIRADETSLNAENERAKSLMLRAWILSGLFFMALPGTLMGFSNLVAISAHHGLGGMSPAWMEGHGHAQVFGWIGSFILGIGFYSQPVRRAGQRIPLACFVLWTAGVLLRWTGNVYEWHWRSLLVVSSAAELMAMLLFLSAASHHKRSDAEKASRKGMEPWMIAVLLSTAALTAAVIFNFVECVRLALYEATPSFPHRLDQKYLVLLGWGFLAPVVWGFSARWLPALLGIGQPRARVLRVVLLLDLAGLGAGVSGWLRVATVMFAAAAISMVIALHMMERPEGKAKTQGVHASFPAFVRLAYVWLTIAGAMGIWAANADVHGGIWGASRHALTVGFAATMVFAIGPRILPGFCGVARLFSTRLMLASLVILQIGCTLRVSSEPLAYEGFSTFAWRVLPVSGFLELSGVLIFAANMAVTILMGKTVFAAEERSESLLARRI